MAQLEIKSKDGKVVGKHEVGGAIASAQPLQALLHRAVVAEEANARQGTQSAKTRSEVRGGGRKPYKQKKTGNARQGSTRSPHYAHGAMALAVKPRDYEKKINRKERRAALLGALHAKIEAGDVLLADRIAFAEPKTKQAQELLVALDLANVRRVLVVLPEYDEATYRSFRNIGNVTVRTAPIQSAKSGEAPKADEPKPAKGKKAAPATLGAKSATFSTRDVLVAHKILIAQDAMKRIEEVWA